MARHSQIALELFESPNPLEQKMGEAFFAEIPAASGHYFFEGRDGLVIYAGKAKNLRTCLQTYGKARLFDVNRKTRQLLFSTEKIRWELASTKAVVNTKARPSQGTSHTEKFPFLYLKYKAHNKRLHLKLISDRAKLEDEEGVQIYGAFHGRGSLKKAYAAILRILWFAAAADKKKIDFDDAPAVLFRKQSPYEYQVRCEARIASQLEAYMDGIRGLNLVQELKEKLLKCMKTESFYHKVLQEDFQVLLDFYERTLSYNLRLRRFHKLGKAAIPQDRIDDKKRVKAT